MLCGTEGVGVGGVVVVCVWADWVMGNKFVSKNINVVVFGRT